MSLWLRYGAVVLDAHCLMGAVRSDFLVVLIEDMGARELDR